MLLSVVINVNEGLRCDDEVPCNIDETCQSGVCTGGSAVSCPDNGEFCTDDVCDPGGTEGNCDAVADVNEGLPCDDDDVCTVDDMCDGQGGCTGTAIDCCDENPDPETLLPYHSCPDPEGTPPYDVDCRVWGCGGDGVCEELPASGLSPDGEYNVYGDVNDDGAVTPTDISCLQRWAADTVVPPFTGCDKGGAGGPVVEFEYIDFAPCRHENNPNGRGDGSLTPVEIRYVQFVGAGSQAPIGDCYYCGGSE
jgi:hypothetical protein